MKVFLDCGINCWASDATSTGDATSEPPDIQGFYAISMGCQYCRKFSIVKKPSFLQGFWPPSPLSSRPLRAFEPGSSRQSNVPPGSVLVEGESRRD